MTAINDLVEKACVDVPLAALYDAALALAGVLPEVFRVELRMPAEPLPEAPEEVSPAPVDPYALAREMEGVLRELVVPERQPAAPAILPPKADIKAPAIINVHSITKELRERVEKLEKETISLPAVCSDLYTGGAFAAGSFTGEAFPRMQAADRAITVSPGLRPPDVSIDRHIEEEQVEREVLEKTFKKSAIESAEQSIKRSASVVRELEDVYERLSRSTIDAEEIKRSTVVELDKTSRLLSETAPEPAPQLRSVEVPAFRLKLNVSPPSEQAADNVKRLSEAMKASEPVKTEIQAPAERPNAAVREMAIAPPALVAVSHSFNIMNRYLSSAAGMAGAVSRAAGEVGTTQAFRGQAPLVRLMLDGTAPASVSVNMLAKAGEAVTVPVPQPILVGGQSPAMSLAVNVASMREQSGGQALAKLASDTGYAPAGREAASASLPPEINNSTSKVSNFHNTFNITVTVKGGGSEDGDLRELGKKIGRILSDEIKRYGGI